MLVSHLETKCIFKLLHLIVLQHMLPYCQKTSRHKFLSSTSEYFDGLLIAVDSLGNQCQIGTRRGFSFVSVDRFCSHEHPFLGFRRFNL